MQADQRVAHLRRGLDCLDLLRTSEAVRRTVREELEAAISRAQAQLVFRPLGDGWVQLGQGDSLVTWRLRPVDASVAAFVLSDRPQLANGLLALLEPCNKRGADALRGRLKRLVVKLEQAGYPRLASAVFGIRVNDETSEVSASRDHMVVTA